MPPLHEDHLVTDLLGPDALGGLVRTGPEVGDVGEPRLRRRTVPGGVKTDGGLALTEE